MNLIAKITDKDILGTEGCSGAKPRLAARAVLKDSRGLYAVIYAKKYGLYSLPGGGIEEGEDMISALKRELLEETGCVCGSIAEIGFVYENRAYCDFTQYSYYYAVETCGPIQAPRLTDKEINDGDEVQWHTLRKVIELITTPEHDTNQRKFIKARDTAALKEYAAKYAQRL